MNLKTYNISFIGSGNLATNLALALEKSSHKVIEICSQNLSNAQLLADKLGSCSVTDSLNFIQSKSEVIIIAIPDNAILEIIGKIKFNTNTILLHSSGTTSLDVFSKMSHEFQTGIFYPLQTFNKDKPVDFANIPILYESENKAVNKILEDLGKSISNHVKFVDSHQRKSIHLAAVFASNFTNRMLNASQKILKEIDIPLSILKPLVFQSIENCFDKSPNESLTGPAKRKDFETIKKHLELLETNSDLQEIYTSITNQALKSF